MYHIYEVRCSLPGYTKKIIGKIKATHIDIALGLARKKYGRNITVECDEYGKPYVYPQHLPWPEIEFGLFNYEQTTIAVGKENCSSGK